MDRWNDRKYNSEHKRKLGDIMELTISVALVILNSVISVSSFALNRKDKSNKDTEKDSYKWGQLDVKLSNIEKTLEKIEKRFDAYDKEFDEKIKEAFEHHIKEYHKEK